MQFDSIIIGGGLAGLVCALELTSKGQKCAVISAGQNAMHFSSGAFSLLSFNNLGAMVEDPIAEIQNLPMQHPYSKIGYDKVKIYIDQVKEKFKNWGINLVGDVHKNSYILTHLGDIRPVWLGFEDTTLISNINEKLGNKALIIDIDGYMDFNHAFIANTLQKQGCYCNTATIRLEEMERLRNSPTEMRSVNIARVMDNIWQKVITTIKGLIKDEDFVVLPAVFGLNNTNILQDIKNSLPIKTVFIGTMPPSVPGIRVQMQLKNSFINAGGVIISGDKVIKANIQNNNITSIQTTNLDNYLLRACNYVLATGSFFSKGLWATPNQIIEPLMNLDIDYDKDRKNWYDENFFNSHNYLGFGVKTNNMFQPSINGNIINNLYAIGSVLSGFNPINLGCGAGTSILTALDVANKIVDKHYAR